MNRKDKIYVTRPSLPPLEEFVKYLEDIWDSRRLTNNGPYHQEFEKSLADYLGVKHISLFCNGTIALQIGLQALKITGEVITTPFTFPATTHAIYWNRCTPVFCDIDPQTFNIDPNKIESLISPDTTAIMPVHVYGNPCDVIQIQNIADIYGLKLFYDAAHAFGVKLQKGSVLNYGDLSMLSFHATKKFNTIEGGALVTNDSKLKKRIDYLKNFGFANEVTVVAPGSNGKMNELQATLGLLQLEYIESNTIKCREIANTYREALTQVPGIQTLGDIENVHHNYCYFPILIDENEFGITRDELYLRMRERGVYARRYFYPLVSEFPSYSGLESSQKNNLPVSHDVSKKVICLPIFADLSSDDTLRVLDSILDNARHM